MELDNIFQKISKNNEIIEIHCRKARNAFLSNKKEEGAWHLKEMVKDFNLNMQMAKRESAKGFTAFKKQLQEKENKITALSMSLADHNDSHDGSAFDQRSTSSA